jgi:hypothetical protein
LSLTIVIPVKTKKAERLAVFSEKNKEYFTRYTVIVIDSGGGECLESHMSKYVKQDMRLWDARRLGYSFVSTEFIMNLDCDVLVPEHYIEDALALFRDNTMLGCVSIFYEDITQHAGILEYGVSIWKTDVLKKLYDYDPAEIDKQIIKVSERIFTTTTDPFCECSYMWRQVRSAGYKMDTLPIRAVHLSAHAKTEGYLR